MTETDLGRMILILLNELRDQLGQDIANKVLAKHQTVIREINKIMTREFPGETSGGCQLMVYTGLAATMIKAAMNLKEKTDALKHTLEGANPLE